MFLAKFRLCDIKYITRVRGKLFLKPSNILSRNNSGIQFCMSNSVDDKIEKNEMGWACGAYG